MKVDRTNIITLVVGARGTGKTQVIKNKVMLPSRRRKKYLFDTADNDVWKDLGTFNMPDNSAIKVPILPLSRLYTQPDGIHRILEPDPDILFPEIKRTTRNALIVLEDATRYLDGRIPDDLKRILYDTKQRNNDLVLVFHSLSDVPPKLVRIADKVILFKTQEVFPTNKYPFPALRHWMEQINAHPSRYFHKMIPLS